MEDRKILNKIVKEKMNIDLSMFAEIGIKELHSYLESYLKKDSFFELMKEGLL